MRDGRPPIFRKWNAPEIKVQHHNPQYKVIMLVNGQERTVSIGNPEYAALENIENAITAPLIRYKNIGKKTLVDLIAKGLVKAKPNRATEQSPTAFVLTEFGSNVLKKLPSRSNW